jgi:hypothetical protein
MTSMRPSDTSADGRRDRAPLQAVYTFATNTRVPAREPDDGGKTKPGDAWTGLDLGDDIAGEGAPLGPPRATPRQAGNVSHAGSLSRLQARHDQGLEGDRAAGVLSRKNSPSSAFSEAFAYRVEGGGSIKMEDTTPAPERRKAARAHLLARE